MRRPRTFGPSSSRNDPAKHSEIKDLETQAKQVEQAIKALG
jgi:hypothetical protein